MADDDEMSTTAQPGVHDIPVPTQIHQLATMLYNILVADEDFNAPILEKLRTDPITRTRNPTPVVYWVGTCTFEQPLANHSHRAVPWGTSS